MSRRGFLWRELKEVEYLLPDIEQSNNHVSGVNVGWHLYHILQVILSVINKIRDSDPNQYKGFFSLKRSVLFALGRIPRGAAKASKSMMPPDTVRAEDIKRKLAEVRQAVPELRAMNKQQFCAHPVFGVLSLKQSKIFLRIHTRHHLRIVRDILKSNRKHNLNFSK